MEYNIKMDYVSNKKIEYAINNEILYYDRKVKSLIDKIFFKKRAFDVLRWCLKENNKNTKMSDEHQEYIRKLFQRYNINTKISDEIKKIFEK